MRCKGMTEFATCVANMLETDDTVLYLNQYVLLYADDTIVLCENAEDLQSSIDAMYEYCNLWNLQVIIHKSKVMVISRCEKIS
jgi:phage tail sheath protein FI